MDVLQLLGALHHALQSGATAADTEGWRLDFEEIRTEVERDLDTDRYDRETLEVIQQKLEVLTSEILSGSPEPDFKPARTWVAALGAAIHRRRSAS